MPFQKGQSGNPAGRPRGVPDRRTQYRKLFEPHVPALIEKAVELACAGDTAALKLCLDRVLPVIRPQTVPVSIPTANEAHTLAEKGQAVASAATTGEISPDEAASLLTMLGSVAKIMEVTELETRLSALEEEINGNLAT